MPGWTSSTITGLTTAIVILAIFLFGCFHGKIRKNQRRFPTVFLAATAVGFVAFLLRFLSFYIGDKFLNSFSWIFVTIAVLCLILWMEQIVFEVPRTAIRSIFTFMAGLSVAFSWVPENTTLSADGTPTWTRAWELFGQLFAISFFIYALGFFVRVGMKAPWKVRVPMAAILVLSIYVTYGAQIIRFFFPAVPELVWSIITGGIAAIILGMIIIICVAYPEFLSVITFTLDRLIVIHAETGVLLFSHSWVKRKKDDVDLIAPLLQALQSMSFEVLMLGHMTDLHLEEGNLMFQKSDHVIAGIISSRSTVYLRTRLSMFIDFFEVEFKQELEKPTPDLAQFQRAKAMVDKLFHAIPLDTTRFGPWRRHHEEKDYLSPEEDPGLIDDLKSLFSGEGQA